MIFLLYAIMGACVPFGILFVVSRHLSGEWDSMRAHARTRPEQRLRWTPEWHGRDGHWHCYIKETGRAGDGWTPVGAFHDAANEHDAIWRKSEKRRSGR